MLRETYLSNLKNLPQGVTRVRVCRPCLLAPSKELLKQYQTGEITWEQYVEQYRLELLANSRAYAYLAQIAEWSKTKEIYLYCYEKQSNRCHRSILLEILRSMGAPIGNKEGG